MPLSLVSAISAAGGVAVNSGGGVSPTSPPILLKSVSSMSTEPPLFIFFGGLGEPVSSLVVRLMAAVAAKPLGELAPALRAEVSVETEALRSDLSFQCSSLGR